MVWRDNGNAFRAVPVFINLLRAKRKTMYWLYGDGIHDDYPAILKA